MFALDFENERPSFALSFSYSMIFNEYMTTKGNTLPDPVGMCIRLSPFALVLLGLFATAALFAWPTDSFSGLHPFFSLYITLTSSIAHKKVFQQYL